MLSIGRAVTFARGLGLATIVVLMAAAPAAAGSNASISTSRGTVTWAHAGDQLSVSDTKKDGLSIRGYVKRDTLGGGEHVVHVAGKGKSKSFVWDLPEGTDVLIQMCYQHGSVVTKCSGWHKGTA